MSRASPSIRPSGFTFVELLLALALSALVAAILGLLVHGLFSAGNSQAARLRGPFAAQAALRTLSREISCAFAPPVKDLAPLQLSASTEIGKPEVVLAFYVPVPASLGYDIERVTYEVAPTRGPFRELRRISAPCSGPFTNAPVTNLLFEGRFALAIEAMTNGTACVAWPPVPTPDKPTLPASLRLTLSLAGEEPFRTEVLIQAAACIQSPIDRKGQNTPDSAEEPAADDSAGK